MTDTISGSPLAVTRWSLLSRGLSNSIVILIALLTVSATNCYTPDGTLSNDQPCNVSASASVCCTQGFLCTSNQLCQPANCWGDGGNPLQLIRGTCTDKTWAAPECQGHFVAEGPTGGEWVMRCGNNSSNYCSSADDCCTRDSFLKFTLDDSTITATAGVVPFTKVTASKASSTATTERDDDSFENFDIVNIFGIFDIFDIIYSPFCNHDCGHTKADNAGSSPSTAIAVGIGVGVGVGVVLVGCLLVVIFMRLRRKVIAAQQNNSAFGYAQQGGLSGIYPPIVRTYEPKELDSQQH
ncbi:uncharacterized protein ACLA_046920 [Aspergillus clavatus NRRL 1]|uniref:Mid2 domain-containing protein n=1 Tax=Aspergillus clavatus (strain ATCC 1007 / CBS 513.65 / DSM 816 / NCTC 3887 / NRRL 1 / QM 1276 / 107) TaxID=344612 RepID=A1CH72_ASPCL|nr:uncharacterized protein ACLA_046920 [Aspergillus clavatus NRRL 1]EAW10227.1 conserved hypothetical protein [Aspergillus clavatus NRRL 1]